MHVVQRRKPATCDGCDLAGNMPVVFDHGQAAVSQILLQQQKVSPVYQEMRGVGVPEQVGYLWGIRLVCTESNPL